MIPREARPPVLLALALSLVAVLAASVTGGAQSLLPFGEYPLEHDARFVPSVHELTAGRLAVGHVTRAGTATMTILGEDGRVVVAYPRDDSARYSGYGVSAAAGDELVGFRKFVTADGDSTGLEAVRHRAADLAYLASSRFPQRFARFRRGEVYNYNNVLLRSPGEIHYLVVTRRDPDAYGAHVYSRDLLRGIDTYYEIPLDSLRSTAFAFAASPEHFYLWDSGQILVRYAREDYNQYRGIAVQAFDDHDYNDPQSGGTEFTGFWSNPQVAYFDSSLFCWATTRVYLPGDTVTAMHLLRLRDRGDIELADRAVLDTAAFENPGLSAPPLNRGTSVSPDGERLYLVASGANAARDTMTWHLHSYAEDFARLYDVNLQLAPADGWTPRVGGVLALADGGAVVWGTQSDELRLFRVGPDSAFVSGAGPAVTERYGWEPWVAPNPVGADGRVRILPDRCPAGAVRVVVADAAGRDVGRFDCGGRCAGRSLALPAARGVYTLVAVG